jgi:hypothetical protein
MLRLAAIARTKPVIEFLCAPEDKGVIAEPVPAKSVMPDWFRRLPAIDKGEVHARNNGLTVKRCMPFIDALTTGWIMPIAATVRLEIKDDGKTVTAGWEFDRELVSNHGPYQVAGSPFGARPPMKFNNLWTIRTAPGWSCLFLPPLNRERAVFECFAGVVDTDTYAARVNFPFVATAADGTHTIEKGTPLVQVIPFRRADAAIEARVRTETKADADERNRIHRSTLASEGWYRLFSRAQR